MGKRTHRWTPPQSETTPHRFVEDSPATARRKQEEREANASDVHAFTWCLWPDCGQYADIFLRVHLCHVHAVEVNEALHREAEFTLNARAKHHAEADANKARTAELIESGFKPGAGDLIPGWVYYIELDGLIKIGFSTNVANRMRAYAPTAKLLAAEPGTKKVERARHQHFGAYLARGREWFQDVPELRTWITTVITEYGSADHMAYTWGGPAKPEPVGTKHIRNRRR